MPNPYQQTIADAFADELQKIAQQKLAKLSPEAWKALGLAGAGALGYEALRRANSDRRMGRAMRVQQGGF